ncbi:MAG: hypothetical protein JNM80_13650 [Phycisphaerae bacterium]|nr:hypothetical protein [Phycisphaerae bacterium]
MLRVGGTDLGRRWLAVLLMVPEAEREGVVAEAERRARSAYSAGDQAVSPAEVAALLRPPTEPPLGEEPIRLLVAHEPVQREGYVERVEVEYKVRPRTSPERLGGPTARERAKEGKKRARGE